MQTDPYIKQTQCWLENTVIGLNFCPFASREFKQKTIHYAVSETVKLEDSLTQLAIELQRLDQDPGIETTLLIFSDGYSAFDDFLELIDYADALVDQLQYRSVYQLAHFHPDYCFADAAADDPSNFTNRSPWPTLHLLRESSLQRAIEHHPDTEQIPETNIKLARKLGFAKMRSLLDRCKQSL